MQVPIAQGAGGLPSGNMISDPKNAGNVRKCHVSHEQLMNPAGTPKPNRHQGSGYMNIM